MKIWGLDIGSTAIKAVELTQTWKSFQVTDYRFRQIEPGGDKGPAFFQALREVFPEGVRERVVLALPADRTMVHRIALPFQERKKNLPVVKYEAEPLLPLAADEVVVDFYSPENAREEDGTLVFAARKEDLRSSLAQIDEAGIDPEAVIPEGLALFWAVKYLAPDLLEEPGAVLDIGHEKAALIIWDEGMLKQVRSIPLPIGAFSAPAKPDAPPKDGRLSLSRRMPRSRPRCADWPMRCSAP
jgi:Tfp pilus assembly PilM family ATPase